MVTFEFLLSPAIWDGFLIEIFWFLWLSSIKYIHGPTGGFFNWSFCFVYKKDLYFDTELAHSLEYAHSMHALLSKLMCGL